MQKPDNMDSSEGKNSSSFEDTMKWTDAPEAESNSFTDALWRLRREFRRIQRKNMRLLGRLCDMSENDTKYDRISNTWIINKIASLQIASGNMNVLTPILSALPHIKLAREGTLDCDVYGGRTAAYSEFTIRDGNTSHPLSLVLDGSSDSAWECVLLNFAAMQFYLGWHAGYSECRIVTDIRRFDEEVDIAFAGEMAWRSIDNKGRLRMLENNFTPRVSMAGDCAKVEYYRFNPFNGLIRTVEEVDMKSGTINHEMTINETIVEYYCRVTY